MSFHVGFSTIFSDFTFCIKKNVKLNIAYEHIDNTLDDAGSAKLPQQKHLLQLEQS